MSDYAEIYDIAERYFSDKRAQMVTLLGKELRTAFAETAIYRPVSIVDFGSGDGRLIRDIIGTLPDDMQQAVQLTCVEPDDSNFRLLKKTFNDRATFFAGLELVQDTMDGYLQSAAPYDTGLMTHMLYHLPVTAWADEINPALQKLKDQGAAYITLVEDGTDIYDLADRYLKNDSASEENSPIGGDYIFARDLDTALEKLPGLNVQKIPNPGFFNIPQDDINGFIRTAQSAPDKLPETPFMRFLGFIMREDPAVIVANKGMMQGLVSHLQEKGKISSTDTAYKITLATAP